MSPKQRIDDERLYLAALEEFTSRSYDDASVNSIIERAGISKGSFYYRFDTKYDLYVELLREGVRRKWEFIHEQMVTASQTDSPADDAADAPADSSVPGSVPPPHDLFDEFLKQADLGVQFAIDHPEYHKLAVMFSREKGSAVYADALRDLGQDNESGLSERIRAAADSGEIRAGLPKSHEGCCLGA